MGVPYQGGPEALPLASVRADQRSGGPRMATYAASIVKARSCQTDLLDHAEAESRRGAILRTFELLDDVDRPIGSDLKGMKQKLLITAALQHNPAVLLLDEPLDGLDVPAQAALKEIIRRQAAKGCVVYSSHILEVVERICDRVGVIHHGRLVAQGSPAELMASEPGRSLSDVFLSLTRA